MTTTTAAPTTRYLAPGWFARQAFNRATRRLTLMGLGVWGSRELRVVGRSSGQVRSTVVNLLEVGDRRYLVAPRGTTQWVRNIRVAGTGQLRVGRRVEQFRAAELPEGDPKVTVLQAYLRRWSWEVGQFFDGVDVDDPAALARVASGYPVFAIEREA